MTSMPLAGAPFSGPLPLMLFVAKATVLLAIAFTVTIPLRRATAGARHLLWLAALVGVLALPLLGRVPALRVGVLPQSLAFAAPRSQAATADATLGDALGGLAPRAGDVMAPNGASSRQVAAADRPDAISPDEIRATIRSTGVSLIQILAIVWAAVAVALLGWLVAGALSVRRIARNAPELLSSDWTVPLCEVADRLDLAVAPRLVSSDAIEMAFACRAFTPTIVVPATAESWSDDRRRAVLMHEMAHIKRHDLLGHALGRVACALYWFHPMVWAAAKNLRAESERACDDLVLSCGTRPSDYAQHLLEMVTSVRLGAPVMALPMARKKEFEGRMLAILDPAIRRASPGRLQAAAVMATVAVLSLTIAAVSPATPTAPSLGVARQPIEQPAPRLQSTPVARPWSTSAVAQAFAQASDQVSDEASTASTGVSSESASISQAESTPFGSLVTSTVASVVGNVLSAVSAGVDLHDAVPDSGRVTLLVHLLATDGDASVRRTAAWGLQGADRTDARQALIKALAADSASSVREMAAWALANYTKGDVLPALNSALRDRDGQVRATSAWAIGSLGGEAESGALASVAADSSAHVKELAIWALGQGRLRSAPPQLINALGDGSPEVREVAAWALGNIQDSTAAPALIKAFQVESRSGVRSAELWALLSMGSASQAVLDVALKSTDPVLRRHAVGMLAGSGEGAWPWPWPWPWPRPSPE